MLGENFLLKKQPKTDTIFSSSFAVEVVELLLRSADKPSVYVRCLAASALWALLTNNQKVREKSFYFDLLYRKRSIHFSFFPLGNYFLKGTVMVLLNSKCSRFSQLGQEYSWKTSFGRKKVV